MSIIRDEVADLQPGDVVEIAASRWPAGSVWRGPLYVGLSGDLFVAGMLVRDTKGLPRQDADCTLTVVSRAPRPLYVNHPRTEPVPGDVVRQESGCPSGHTWHYLGDGEATGRWWRFDDHHIPFDKDARLRLLVDGETGQAVQ